MLYCRGNFPSRLSYPYTSGQTCSACADHCDERWETFYFLYLNFVILYQKEKDLISYSTFPSPFLKIEKLLWGAVLLIRIRKDPHHFGDLDPHPHQIKIRIRTRIRIRNKIDKLDPEPDPQQN
jgi:hypothetical protein